MGKTQIKVDCVDQRLHVSTQPVIASGGRNEDVIEFTFCPLWDGLEKFTAFRRDLDPETVYRIPIEENRCTIPQEVLVEEGWIRFGVFGTNGDVLRTSEELKYHIDSGASISGGEPSEPTPELWERILAEKVSIDQGAENAGKILGIDANGKVMPIENADDDANSNLVNGEAEGSLRSVTADPETDEYKLGEGAFAIGAAAASGKYSFAAGHATASKFCAFALGNGASAHGDGAFAANGGYSRGIDAFSSGVGTSAYSEAQHVQGKYNIIDANGKYQHIVGNGTGRGNLSNAHTLDWNGNAWFAGDVIVGGKSQDDADAKVLATREYVDGKIAEIEIPSVKGLASEKYVDDKIDSIQIPSIEGLATEKFVEEKIGKIEIPEVPSLDGYATEKYVDDKIANSGGGSGGGAGTYTIKVPADINLEGEVIMIDNVNYDEFAELLYNGGTLRFDCSEVAAFTETMPLNPLIFTMLMWGYLAGVGIMVAFGMGDMQIPIVFTNGTWTPPTT